jgi:hypothetical protein
MKQTKLKLVKKSSSLSLKRKSPSNERKQRKQAFKKIEIEIYIQEKQFKGNLTALIKRKSKEIILTREELLIDDPKDFDYENY